MTSPFADFANAKLIFQIPSAEMESDNYGNQKPKTVPFLVVAVLRPRGRTDQRRTQEGAPSALSGVGQLANTWVGQLVDPMLLPPTINPGDEAEAEITTGLQFNSVGEAIPLIEKGVFKLESSPLGPELIAAGVIEVSPISGTFIRNN